MLCVHKGRSPGRFRRQATIPILRYIFPMLLYRLSWTGCILVFLALSAASAQTPVTTASSAVPLLNPGERLEITEHANYTVHRNNEYAGHLQRETRISLVASHRDDLQSMPRSYRGEVLVTEDTIRNLRTIASPLSVRAATTVEFDGTRLLRRAGASVTQGIPTVPARGVDAGWEAPAVVRLQLDSETTRSIPVVVAYRPRGYEVYRGERVFRIEYGYALRWPIAPLQLEEHPAADLFEAADLPQDTVSITGNRQGVVLLPAAGGLPVLHRTELTEQIVASGGDVEDRRGFLLRWYRGPTGSPRIVERLQDRTIPGVDIERDPYDRVRLSIRDLQFVADQAALLPGETGRLDALSELLQSLGDTTILVTGHTADIGLVENQMNLSVARARRITEELIARGVAPGRLRYEGRGATEPIGDNNTEQGRAANRRVEITLLQDS